MKLLRPAEVPISERDQVFSYSRAHALWAISLTAVGAGALSYLAWLKQPEVGYFIFAVVFIFIFLFRKLLIARFHPANWLVRLSDDGLFIKFRSYLNNHFPEHELIVVFIAHAEIRSANLRLWRFLAAAKSPSLLSRAALAQTIGRGRGSKFSWTAHWRHRRRI